ncbi:MAG: CHRD domain-containing protein [Acidobacteria bacterium]|nr:CHRD domain-containing protein [Acidobacteriota bacterium]
MKLQNFALGVLFAASTAFAAPIYYITNLTGPGENPPNASPATGIAEVLIDTALHTLSLHVTFNGITGGPITAGHIHCCVNPPANVGVAVGFPSFPMATSGNYVRLFDLTQNSTFNGTFLGANGGTAAGAETALAAGLAAGQAYVNLHNASFPGGEIRGFLQLAPEPSTIGLTGAALVGLAFLHRRRG